MVKYISYIILALTVISCGKVDLAGFFVSPGDSVDKRFEQSKEYTQGLPYDMVETEEEYVIYICTDIHLDRTHINLDRFMSDFRNDEKSSFGLILGDIIDRKGKMEEFYKAIRWNKAEQQYDRPVFVIPGNHDMFFGQWKDFKRYFGASAYFVEIQSPIAKDIVIALDSASGTHGSSQIKWLRQLLEKSRSSYRYCIVITHTNIFKTDNSQIMSGNMPLEETSAITNIFSTNDVDMVFQGHDHYREDLVYMGVRYTTVGTIKDSADAPEYLKVHIGQDKFEYEWVYL